MSRRRVRQVSSAIVVADSSITANGGAGMTTRWARVARGLFVAVFATLVAAVSHSLGGEAFPRFSALALSAAFAVILSITLAGKTLSLPRLALSVGLSQGLFHTIFSTMGDSGATMTQLGHHGAIVIDAAGSSAHGSHGSGWMWLAHAVAAIVTIAMLRHGERAFWALVSGARYLLTAYIPLLGASVTPLPPRRRPASFFLREFHRLEVLLVSLRYRGPPVIPVFV